MLVVHIANAKMMVLVKGINSRILLNWNASCHRNSIKGFIKAGKAISVLSSDFRCEIRFHIRTEGVTLLRFSFFYKASLLYSELGNVCGPFNTDFPAGCFSKMYCPTLI